MLKTMIIMAGGAGSRFGGNKQLEGIGPSGEALFEYSVYDALLAGFERIVCVIRPGMEDSFEAILGRFARTHPDREFLCAVQSVKNLPVSAGYLQERTKPLGTVHALLSASKYIEGPFSIINADDYYGRDAIRQICSVMDGFSSAQDAAMIVYRLKNTLSRHGTVTRGICDISSGKLERIREAYKIMLSEELEPVEVIDGKGFPIPSDSFVSMNIWAFHDGILPAVEKYFNDFISTIEPGDNSSECLLPEMAESFIEKNILKIMAYPTDCRWFGLTYRNDTTDAAWELDKRHADGTYPEKLFQ